MTNGERFRQARTARGLSQDELAAVVGVTQAAISAIERDDTKSPSYETVIRVARALDVAPDELVIVRDASESAA